MTSNPAPTTTPPSRPRSGSTPLIPLTLKHSPPSLRPISGTSSSISTTHVPAGTDPRKYYLNAPVSETPAPCISASEFVPRQLVEHLMRRKKDTAMGIKFIKSRNAAGGNASTGQRGRLDGITNMEGALHTFVTPVVECWMHGDYYFSGGHQISKFPVAKVEDGKEDGKEFQKARKVVLSASIQPDFENEEVMMRVCALQEDEAKGEVLGEGWEVLGALEKQDDAKRGEYDEALRRHMIAHLTANSRLPSVYEVQEKALPMRAIISLLERLIISPSGPVNLENVFAVLSPGDVISIEVLYNVALHQLRNELSALEALCPQGYIYTSDPAAIFAQALDGATLLNRLQILAAKTLSPNMLLKNMRVFAFNSYADPPSLTLLKYALGTQSSILVCAKAELFRGQRHTFAPERVAKELESCLLVIHNNSDGFGQNVQFEWRAGSLDGAIGSSGSAAASLKRERADLVDWVM